MPEYKCDVCNFTTRQKTAYGKHLNTQKHKRNITIHNEKIVTLINDDKINPITIHGTLYCKYCEKQFSSSRGARRHERENCKIMKAINNDSIVPYNNNDVIHSIEKKTDYETDLITDYEKMHFIYLTFIDSFFNLSERERDIMFKTGKIVLDDIDNGEKPDDQPQYFSEKEMICPLYVPGTSRCKYCIKEFTTIKGAQRHERKSCKHLKFMLKSNINFINSL
jgi:hypothetical protein